MFYVEVIRTLAEFVVYTEKVKRQSTATPNYFDKLCERDTFDQFSKILELNNRFVNMQLIQTVSIFLYNISHPKKKSKIFWNINPL